MKWSIIVFTAVLFFPSLAFSEGTRAEKVEALMQAQGVLEMWQQQIDQGREDSREMGTQIFAQMKSQLNPNDIFMDRLEGAFNRFIEKAATPPWTARDITDTWAKYYGEKFSDDELDQLIAFYSSDIGQKEVLSSKEALVEFGADFKAKNLKFTESILQDYINDLRMIVSECKKQGCTKA